MLIGADGAVSDAGPVAKHLSEDERSGLAAAVGRGAGGLRVLRGRDAGRGAGAARRGPAGDRRAGAG